MLRRRKKSTCWTGSKRWLRESDERSHKIDGGGSGDDGDTNNRQKRIFGATSSLVTGSCPFAHVGASDAARKILREGGHGEDAGVFSVLNDSPGTGCSRAQMRRSGGGNAWKF